MAGSKPLGRLPKTHKAMLRKRLRQRTWRDKDGKLHKAPEWFLRLKQGGNSVWFPTGESSREKAVVKAAEIWAVFAKDGLEAAKKQHKSGAGRKTPSALTVGDWFGVVDRVGLSKTAEDEKSKLNTVRSYKNALRTVIGVMFGLQDQDRYDSRGEVNGSTRWCERIDKVRLARITPGAIARWKERFRAQWEAKFTNRPGKPDRDLDSMDHTKNSYVRRISALFADDVITKAKAAGVDLKADGISQVPFAECQLTKEEHRFVPKIQTELLVRKAWNELRAQDPQCWLAFLLCLGAALRKKEADLLEWNMISFGTGYLQLRKTEYFVAKTRSSYESIKLPDVLLEELREAMPKPREVAPGSPKDQFRFVLAGRPPKKPSELRGLAYYRCQETWERLTQWLVKNEVPERRPIHELRKQAGAIVATRSGLFAASAYLRHANYKVTEQFYAAFLDKERIHGEAAEAKSLSDYLMPPTDPEVLPDPAADDVPDERATIQVQK